MKHLKYFENKNKEYEFGDFLIGQIGWIPDKGTIEEANEYLSHVAGEIIDVELNGDENDFVTLRYMDLPSNIFDGCENILSFGLDEILRYATEIEIETFKLKEKSNKFNL